MASYHCTVKVGSKGKAAPHAAYLSREGKYSGKTRYEDLEATAAGNMPPWAEHNTAHFWAAADEHERSNGATYREIEIALPREMTPEQRRELVEEFIAQEIGARHAYQWAIHTPRAALEQGEQPHAHIMYSERTRDAIERDPEQYFRRYNGTTPERGGCRKDSAGTEERLQATRQRWADVQNAHLERHGHADRVDHRSLKEQGISRAPEQHLGGAGVRALGERDIKALLEHRAAEGEQERAQKAVAGWIDLSGDLSAAKAERARQQAAQAKVHDDQTKAREFARQATEQFKAERAARDFGRQATAQFKAELERQRQYAEQQQAAERALASLRQEAERTRQAEIEQEQQRERQRGRGRDDGFSR